MLRRETVIVLHHYLDEGLTKTAIAHKLGVSRRTVQRYAKSGKRDPSYGPRPQRPTKLGPYKAYLDGRLAVYPQLSAVRLLDEIRLLGYSGCYTRVKDYLREHRPRPTLSFEQRFEVEPGSQAQVDFATFRTPFGVVHALLVVLSWSRLLWVRFSFHQDQLTLLGGLHSAFVAFGGVPRTVLFDRLRAAVAGQTADGSAIFNEELLRFAAHYGFQPRACRPYRAQTKGRVERAVSYLRQGFFYGRSFRDLEDLNSQCSAWLQETANARLHGTTGEVPALRLKREATHLSALPEAPYIPLVTVGRRVARDGFVSYNGNAYSVPDGLEHSEVQVRATLTDLWLLQDGRVLAVHPLLDGRGERRLHPSHTRGRGERLARERDAGESFESVTVQRRPLDVYERVLA
jgi:transposase